MITKFNILFLTLLKIGKIKYAPGTIASLFTCLLFLLLINVFDILIIFFCTLIIFCYSFVAINNSFENFDAEDPQEIVNFFLINLLVIFLLSNFIGLAT